MNKQGKKEKKEQVVTVKAITQEFIDWRFSKNQYQIKDEEASDIRLTRKGGWSEPYNSSWWRRKLEV